VALWRAGTLPRFCFISLGVAFHAGAETMMSTIMPAIVRDIGGVTLNGWTFALYEIGSIIAGAAAGRLATYWPAACLFALGGLTAALAPAMPIVLCGRLLSGFGGGALISLSFVALQRLFPAAVWPQLMAILSIVGDRGLRRPALWQARCDSPLLAVGNRPVRPGGHRVCRGLLARSPP
jgi:MFS family permease